MTAMLSEKMLPTVGPTIGEIAHWLIERRRQRGPVIEQMRLLQAHYEGSIVIPLPEMDKNEKAAVANLVKIGLDQTARRIASTPPMLWYPPLDETSDRSKTRADVRRKANLGWWEENKIGRKLRRRAQYLIGYSCAPVLIRPDRKKRIPAWQTRDPLCTYPAPSPDPDEMVPENVIFTYSRSVAWAQRAYPEQFAQLTHGTKRVKPDDMLVVVEYIDGDVTVLCLGSNPLDAGIVSTVDQPLFHIPPSAKTLNTNRSKYTLVELERIGNRTEQCPVVIPGLINLGKPMGQFDAALPMFAMQAKLQALQIIAVEKAIYPDTYLIGNGTSEPRFIAGPFDGRTGEVNIVENGTIQQLRDQPGSLTKETIDGLERNQRVTTGVAAEMGGESPTNVRTGRRGEAVMSAQVDFGVQEAQELLAESMVEENKAAMAIAKGWFGSERKSFHVHWKGSAGPVDYIPNKDFESDANVVMYPHAGADAAGLAIGIGQRIGMGLMSAETGQELDPWITDPQREKQRVAAEALDKAMLGAVTSQAGSGQMPPHDVGRLKALVLQGMTVEDALEQVQREAQERQASSGQPGSPDGPVPAGSPEAQAGIATPGMGAEQPVIPAPPQAGHNLMNLLTQLRGPTRTTPAERGAG